MNGWAQPKARRGVSLANQLPHESGETSVHADLALSKNNASDYMSSSLTTMKGAVTCMLEDAKLALPSSSEHSHQHQSK
jgi:hypothetical protein